MMKKTSFLGLVLGGLVVLIELINFSFFSFGVWGIDLDYCDVEWFILDRNQDYFLVLEIAPNYCILDFFVDYEGHSLKNL